MVIIVTGAAGFIGWHVTKLLLANGHQVIGLDSMNDAYDPRMKEWRLSQLATEPSFTFQKIDITDMTRLTTQFSSNSIDAVINLGARAGVRQSLENPWVYYQANVIGTLNLLELCRQHNVTKFVLASTSSVYGNQASHAFTEDLYTDYPLSPYAASKKAAEVLTYTYHDTYGIDITVFRYFTVYGPAGRPDMSVFRFIRWVDQDLPIRVFGDGKQSRDFTFVEDVARGTVAGLSLQGHQVINLGNNSPITLLELIGLIKDRLGKDPLITHEPASPLDVPATWANISRAEKLLGWRPLTDIKDGIDKSVDWYLQNRLLATTVSL